MSNAQHSSASNEWYTPVEIVELSRMVMGSIDFDPASCAEANAVVGATLFVTKEQNGLMQPWAGNVFCNPPGGRGGAKRFWEKALNESVHCNQIIFLGFNAGIVQTCQSVLDYPVCFPSKRLRFKNPILEKATSPTHNNCIIYIPSKVDKTEEFIRTFGYLGRVVIPATRPHVQLSL